MDIWVVMIWVGPVVLELEVFSSAPAATKWGKEKADKYDGEKQQKAREMFGLPQRVSVTVRKRRLDVPPKL